MSGKYREEYRKKLTTPEEAAKLVKSGDFIANPLGLNAPPALTQALCRRYKELEDVRIFCTLDFPSEVTHHADLKGHIFYHSGFLGVGGRVGSKLGIADYDPHSISCVAQQFLSHHHLNVFWTTVSPMDENGFMTTGMGCVYDRAYLKAADIVIVEVNENLPRLVGDAFVHIDEVDHIVENTAPLVELAATQPTEKDITIGKYIADLVDDGACIQLGIGGIPNAVGMQLYDKRDLGVHTEMFTDCMMELFEAGVITNRKKTFMPDRMAASFALGSAKLYRFLHNNQAAYFVEGAVSNDENIIGKNDKMVSINTCLAVDLAGQVCSESIGTNQYSGVGGAHDFARGARRSKGGQSFFALYSTAKDDTISTISAVLPPGSYVTIPRPDVMNIVTEYGVARLVGKTRRERARELINIAHPKFRAQIEEDAKKYGIL